MKKSNSSIHREFCREKLNEPKQRSSKKTNVLRAKPTPSTVKALDSSNNLMDFSSGFEMVIRHLP